MKYKNRFLPYTGLALALAVAFAVLTPLALHADQRDWKDSAGNTVKAEYVKSTEESVTLRMPNLKTVDVPLDKLSEEDRAHVKELREKEKEENTAKLKIKGEIIWRLDNHYRSMSVMTEQGAEIWTWDEEEKAPKEKVTSVRVKYNFSMNYARNDLAGEYETEEAVSFPKDAKLVVIATLRLNKDSKLVEAKDTSVPMSIPQESDGVIKLPTARASAR